MDLAIGAKRVFVMMTLFAKDGTPKLVPECTYPLTGVGCVNRVYTDHAVFEITDDGVVVRETFGTSYDELAERLDVPLAVTQILRSVTGSPHGERRATARHPQTGDMERAGGLAGGRAPLADPVGRRRRGGARGPGGPALRSRECGAPMLAGFSAAWCSPSCCSCDLITTVLLVGLYRNGRGPPDAGPGHGVRLVRDRRGAARLRGAGRGQRRSRVRRRRRTPRAWLFVSRHVGPPLLIALALAPVAAPLGGAGQRRPGSATGWACWPGAGWCCCSGRARSRSRPLLLPGRRCRRIVGPGHRPLRPLVLGLVLAVNAVAVVVSLVGVTGRRDRSGVEVWAIVAAFAWCGDVGFVAMYEERYTVAYYGAPAARRGRVAHRAGQHPGGHLAAAPAGDGRRRRTSRRRSTGCSRPSGSATTWRPWSATTCGRRWPGCTATSRC